MGILKGKKPKQNVTDFKKDMELLLDTKTAMAPYVKKVQKFIADHPQLDDHLDLLDKRPTYNYLWLGGGFFHNPSLQKKLSYFL